jgi:NAD(P)-dependent dehydrogenase (short-subunit alcohol dehydrogenase family)
MSGPGKTASVTGVSQGIGAGIVKAFVERDFNVVANSRKVTQRHGQGDRMKDLLTRTLDAHGGLSRWREIEAFQLKVSIGGGLWRLKGLPDGLRDVTLGVQAHRPIVTITPFGGEAPTGHFTTDRVWIEDANGGDVEERARLHHDLPVDGGLTAV